MKNFGKQQQFTQGTGFGYQTTVGFYTQKILNSLFGVSRHRSPHSLM